LPNTPIEVAVAISVGPNQRAESLAGTLRVNACAMAQIVCPSMATANKFGFTAAHLMIEPIVVSKAPRMHESFKPFLSSKN